MNENPESKRTLCHPLSLPSRIVLCLAIGASLAVSNDLATGIAIAGGLFVALTPVAKRD